MRRAVQGVAALIAVMFILFGWPWLLWYAATGPLADYLPNFSNLAFVLTHPDATGLLLALVLLAAGAAWAVTAGALLIELFAQVRGVSPASFKRSAIGGLLPRASMSRLAAAALFMVPVSGALAGTPAAAAQAPEVPAVAAVSTQETCSPDARPAMTTHTVRTGETLWSVADDELGDGGRYPEVFRASKRLTQPDGGRLRDPDLIRPGWRLLVPTDAQRSKLNCPDGANTKDAAPREPAAGASKSNSKESAAEGQASKGSATASAERSKPQPSAERLKPQSSVERPKPQSSVERPKPQPSAERPKPQPSAERPKPQPSTERLKPQPSVDVDAPPPLIDRSPGPRKSNGPLADRSASVKPKAIEQGASSATSPSLPAPDVRLAGAGSDRAELTWSQVPGASSYWVIVQGQSMQVPGTAIALRGLAADTEYRVEVRTVFPSGDWSKATVLRIRTAPAPTASRSSARQANLRALRHPGARGTTPALNSAPARRTAAAFDAATARHSATIPESASPATRCVSQMRAALGIAEDAMVAAEWRPDRGHVAARRALQQVRRPHRGQLTAQAATLAQMCPPQMDRSALIDQAMELSSYWLPGTAAENIIRSGVTSVRT